MSCVAYVASFSGLSFFIAHLVFSNIYVCCVLCTLCCQFLLIFILIAPSVFSNMYLSCVLWTLCCQFVWIVLFHYPFGILDHLFVLRLVPYAASFSRFSFFITPSVLSSIFFVLRLVYLMLQVSLDCPFSLPFWYSLTLICPMSCVSYVASFSGLSFFIAHSVFSNIYLCCVLCTLCCQFLWIVLFHCTFGIL